MCAQNDSDSPQSRERDDRPTQKSRHCPEVAACLKHGDIDQSKRKFDAFASIPFGAILVSFSATVNTKDADTRRLLKRRRERTNELRYLAKQRVPYAAGFSP